MVLCKDQSFVPEYTQRDEKLLIKKKKKVALSRIFLYTCSLAHCNHKFPQIKKSSKIIQK